jgi:hypothetical protein
MSQQSILKSELEHIRKVKCVTIFWMTETQARAERLVKAEESGAIVRCDRPNEVYPRMRYRVNMAKMPKIKG